MGVVDDAVEDGVGDGRFADHVVPLSNGKLGGDQGRFSFVALLEDFEQIEPLLIGQGMGSPVIEDEQLDACQLVNQTWKAAIEPCQGEIFEQTWHAQVEDGMIEPCRLASEGAGQPGFTGAGLPGNNQVLLGFEPGSLGQ